MQAGGRRFDPVWLHQTAAGGNAPAKIFEKLVRENRDSRALDFGRRAPLLSDIVKRRSIRAPRVT